jgi:hypothetical protein
MVSVYHSTAWLGRLRSLLRNQDLFWLGAIAQTFEPLALAEAPERSHRQPHQLLAAGRGITLG